MLHVACCMFHVLTPAIAPFADVCVQDDIVAKLTQQNTALRAQAAAAGHDVDAAMGGSAAVSSGGPSSKKLSAMLAASEKRSADCLARVQTLLKREANLMEETASLHEQLDRAKVRVQFAQAVDGL